MIRLWFLIWYFTRRPKDPAILYEYTDEITRPYFIFYLMNEKRFCEDWQNTLIRWYYRIINNHKIPESFTKRSDGQKKKINDLIDKALEKKLLVSRTSGRPTTLVGIYPRLEINWRGRDFLKPHYFIEACTQEFGYLASIFISFIFGAAGSTFLAIFWNKIINYLVSQV